MANGYSLSGMKHYQAFKKFNLGIGEGSGGGASF